MDKFLIGFPGRKELIDLCNMPQSCFMLGPILRTLANINRFNGRGFRQVTVLQHSFFVARILEVHKLGPSFVLGGLCHDFAEAFIGDMINPIKKECQVFIELEEKVMDQIRKNMTVGPLDSYEVKFADLIALRYEAEYCGFDVSNWDLPKVPDTIAHETYLELLYDALAANLNFLSVEQYYQIILNMTLA